MPIEEHKSLKDYNTFKIDCTARYFSSIDSIESLKTRNQSNYTYPVGLKLQK